MFVHKLIDQYKFSLRRSRKVFHHVRELLLKKKHKLEEEAYLKIKDLLTQLKEAIDQKEHLSAYAISKKLRDLSKTSLKKTPLDFFNEWVVGIGFTLLSITLINQLWFQHYQIPSGSMRPTLLEKDRVIATKTCFGINLPFKQSHLYFNPNSLKRGNIAIFTVDNLPPKENKSRYLFLFNTKKQMVKRLVGKPGDTLYFYGGKVYGIDKDLKEITEFQDLKIFQDIEHIPFNTFEGKVTAESPSQMSQVCSPVYISQMGQDVAKLYLNSQSQLQGKFSNGHQWVEESPNLEYKELWGIKNYAMVKMLDRQEALDLGYDLSAYKENFFLELHHSPHTQHPKPHLGVDLMGRLRPMLSLQRSLIEVNPKHMQKIKRAMSTARFVISKGYGGNYSIQRSFKPHTYSPKFEGVEDGTYEFIDGVAFRVTRSGMQRKLSARHPLNSRDPHLIQKLFNMGMEMISLYQPGVQNTNFIPHRYAYFRNGSLMLLNQQIYSQSDPALSFFLEQEKDKRKGFVDSGNPIVDGKLNKDLIMNYGLRIPNGFYLFLGDNHAGSRDCRDFGFIPEKNIQGSPAIIIWPTSSRFGFLKQRELNWFNMPNLTVWTVAAIAILSATLYSRKYRKKSI